MKNILFLVTGMTPQIITETIWALACNPENDEQWIPDEVHVLSTQDGLTQIKSRLFADGIFEQFKTAYPKLSQVQFGVEQLHVIQNEQHEALADLKTPDDNESAANCICEKVQQFTQDDDVKLHVSIAGGRKTMGFYAGYALSLYGRAQDEMSHVLVEDKFESARDFFYPTLEDTFVTDRLGKVWNVKDAQVWLAKIPFVRLRDAVKDKHQVKNDNFSQTVSKINESFNDVTLKIDLAKQVIIVNNKFTIGDLAPREFALLHWFAENRKANKSGIVAPRIHATTRGSSAEDAEYLQQLTSDFLPYYTEVKSAIEDDFMVDKKFFESVKSNLKKCLESHLGLELANKMAITQVKKNMPFYLDILPNSIEIEDSFKK